MRKSRDYLMKCLVFVLLFGFIFLGAIGGCNNNGGGQDGTRALTENDFANDTTLRANPEKHLVVKFLEHPDSKKPENDTGEVGYDTIPYTYTRTLEHIFCWEDDDAEAGHFMELDDALGNEILRIDANGECVTELIEAGDYLMHIHHDGKEENARPIFIIPVQNGGLGAKIEETISEGIVGKTGRILSNILKKLDISITRTTHAQTVEDNISTLLSTNSCEGCDLGSANLFNANLHGADFRNADSRNTNLINADLSNADLGDADLHGATLTGATLTGAT